MRLRLALAGMLVAVRTISAQSAAEHIAMGDRDHAALNLASAVKHYEAALALEPKNYDALVKAAYDAVDLGEFNPSEEQRKTLYATGQDYARRAVEANPQDAEGHFQLARAVGRNALTMGKRDQVKFAKVVYDEATEAIKLHPNHAGALHVLGVWNQHIMQLNWIQRTAAKTLLGGKIFGEASWESAQRFMEQAVAADPKRITHRLDLGLVYKDRGDNAKAREQFEAIAQAPATDFNDNKYKELAAAAIRDVR